MIGFRLAASIPLVLGAVFNPLTVDAQPTAKVPRVGYVSTNVVVNSHLVDAFRQGLRDLGYVEGRNLLIEYRDAEGKLERFPGA